MISNCLVLVLHDSPHPFIDHCMREAADNSSLQVMPSSTVVGAFSVSARNGKSSNEVFMGNDTSLSRCTCKECQRKKWLCKHFFVVFECLSERTSGADLGKMLTDLLQNECRRRKLLGVTGACSPEIFSILTT